MPTLNTWLQHLQLVVFLAAAVAALRVWWAQRSRPAALLAATFATLGVTLVVSRLVVPAVPGSVAGPLGDLVVLGLAAFPWLLALFAWSFERPWPRWLLAAGIPVGALWLWATLLPPFPDDGQRTAAMEAFVLTFITYWALVSVAAATRLWRGGGGQPLARSRTRIMAVGALVLTAALLLAGTAGGQDSVLQLTTISLSLVAALLFIAGFAPPRALRVWWRRRATNQWHHMQTELISALTPRQAAQAVTPLLSEMLGNGVAIVAGDGELLAHAGLELEEAHAIAARIKTGEPPADGDEVVPAGSTVVVMRTTSYTPLFGQDERDIVAGFALQLQLALERAELYEAHERARRSLERANQDLQAMGVGLAHDLRNTAITINGYAELLPDMDTREELEEAVAGIQRSGEYLNRLIESLVELSRVGATHRDPTVVDLAEVLSRVVARLRSGYPRITVDADTLPRVMASPLAMEQVFDNLLTNAAKHGGRDDLTITIRHQIAGPTVTIDVADDGFGIHPSDRRSVFVPFQRGRNASGSGSGIGLGLVRRIVESHDGTIELLDSDVGAHFRITLPHPSEAAATTA